MGETYEQLCEKARKASQTTGRYAAVVEVINYRTGTGRMTVAGGKDKIVTKSRGPEFMGVNAQYFNGAPCK
jgi:hypothetical protein